MKYLLQNASGDIGEHFVCYTLLSDLNYPIRLISTDLGIDGEMEIIDERTKKSTSKIVKFQVKSQQKAISKYKNFKISKEHKVYWENFVEPILFFLYTHEDKKIYVKLLTPFSFFYEKNNEYVEINKTDLYSKELILRSIDRFKKSNYSFFEKYRELLNKIDDAIINKLYNDRHSLRVEKKEFIAIAKLFYWGYDNELKFMDDILNGKLRDLDDDDSRDGLENIY